MFIISIHPTLQITPKKKKSNEVTSGDLCRPFNVPKSGNYFSRKVVSKIAHADLHIILSEIILLRSRSFEVILDFFFTCSDVTALSIQEIFFSNWINKVSSAVAGLIRIRTSNWTFPDFSKANLLTLFRCLSKMSSVHLPYRHSFPTFLGYLKHFQVIFFIYSK